MTAPHPLFEPEVQEKATEIVEPDVRIAPAVEDLDEGLLMPGHCMRLPSRANPGQRGAVKSLPPQNAQVQRRAAQRTVRCNRWLNEAAARQV